MIKLPTIELLALDVDGVLTDGTLWYGPGGSLIKGFHVQDGYGIRQLQAHHIHVAIITGRNDPALHCRAQDLGIAHVDVAVKNKADALQALVQKLRISPKHTAFVGDDHPDLAAMQICGTPIAVANAMDEVKQQAHYVTKRCGGQGAVREVCDWILTSS